MLPQEFQKPKLTVDTWDLSHTIKGDMKEVKMSYKIDQNDFDVRRKRVQKFIGEGDRVRFRF